MSTKTRAGTLVVAALSVGLSAGCTQWNFGNGGELGQGGDYDAGITLTTPPLSGDVTLVASDTNVSSTLVVSGTTLYFLDRGATISDSVQALDLGSGDLSTLFLAAPDPTAAIEDLAADASNVYVTQVSLSDGAYSSRLSSIPRNGEAVATLATATEPLFNVAVAGDVYYAGESALFQLSPNGGSPTSIAGSVNTLTSVGNAAYWVEADVSGSSISNAEVFTESGSGSTKAPSLLATFDDGLYSLLAGNSTSLFWLTSPDSGSYIVQASLGGGAPTLFTPVSGTVLGLAADDDNVYVLSTTPGTTTAELDEYSISDGGYTTLVSGIQKPNQGTAQHALALDGNSNVYFATVSGIMSVPE